MIDELKATLVSLMPFPFAEHKTGIYPGDYFIKAASDDKPEFLVVEGALHYIYLGEERGSLEARIPAHELAAALVYDYVSSLSCSTGSSVPALFWLPGTYRDVEKIKKDFADRIESAIILQKNWFLKLVSLADDDWSKYHRHTVISDHQRHAAKYLHLEREWLIIPKPRELKLFLCPACKSNIHPEASICPFCRTNLKDLVQPVNTLKEL